MGETPRSEGTPLAICPTEQERWDMIQCRRILKDPKSLYAVAGRLDLKSGGPGFQDVMIPRRSLYLTAVRTGTKTAEFGALFDAPDLAARAREFARLFANQPGATA